MPERNNSIHLASFQSILYTCPPTCTFWLMAAGHILRPVWFFDFHILPQNMPASTRWELYECLQRWGEDWGVRRIQSRCTLPPLIHPQLIESVKGQADIRSSMRRSFWQLVKATALRPRATFPKNQKLLSVSLSNQTTHHIGYFKFLSGKRKTSLLQALSVGTSFDLHFSFSLLLVPPSFLDWMMALRLA